MKKGAIKKVQTIKKEEEVDNIKVEEAEAITNIICLSNMLENLRRIPILTYNKSTVTILISNNIKLMRVKAKRKTNKMSNK